MIKLLFTAITTYFNAGAPAGNLYTSVGGRFYLNEAPQGATLPYIRYQMISDIPEYWFVDKIHETFSIQFSLFSESPSATEILNIYTYLSAYFDDCDITVAGYTDLKFERSAVYPLTRDAEDQTWHLPVEYTVLLRK